MRRYDTIAAPGHFGRVNSKDEVVSLTRYHYYRFSEILPNTISLSWTNICLSNTSIDFHILILTYDSIVKFKFSDKFKIT